MKILSSLLIIVAAAALPAACQQPTSQFVITKGKDTVGVELFSRDSSTLSSEIRLATGLSWQLSVNLKPDGSMTHVEATRLTRQGVSTGVSLHFGDTLVTATITAPGGTERDELPVHGKVAPFLAISLALAEQIVQASHLADGKSMTWTVVRLGAGDTATLTASRFHPDSIKLSASDVELRLALSKQGEIIGGRHVGQDWIFERKKTR